MHVVDMARLVVLTIVPFVVMTTARGLLGQGACLSHRRICVIGQTHNILELDNTCLRISETLAIRLVIGDNSGISD